MSFRTRSKYKGWTLVETGHNYYHACKRNIRIAIGAIKHGDREELVVRFMKIIDGLEGRK